MSECCVRVKVRKESVSCGRNTTSKANVTSSSLVGVRMPEQGRRDKNDVFGGLISLWFVFDVHVVPEVKVCTTAVYLYLPGTW